MTPAPAPVDWAAVWSETAHRFGDLVAAGRGHLLTEDTLRTCLIDALISTGVAPDRLTIEVFAPALAGGKLDLVVDRLSGTVLELKYPRGSRTGTSPDTMTFGELLRDFLRVAVVPASERWVVQVLEPRLREFLRRRADVPLAWRVGESFTLTRQALEGLPKTALDALGATPWLLPVEVECMAAVPVDVDLGLFVFHVAAPASGDAAPLRPAAGGHHQGAAGGASQTVPRAPARKTGGARAAILAAVASLTARSGRPDVTVQEVVDELRRTGSGYAESTIRTMMTSHMCAQVMGPGIGAFEDLDRVDRGLYRLR